MGTDNKIFLEVIEWFDQTGQEMLHRIPEGGSGEIKLGAQLTVRESQAAVFFYNGRACDVFGPGRHTLVTANLPILNKILSIPWGMTSPLRAEVYFTNMKVFPNLKWGTKNPVAFKDSELGLVRLRAHGICNIRVTQPVLFINSIVGTMGTYTLDDIEDFIGRVILSRFNDHLGENLDTLINLPSQYDELSESLALRLAKDFSHYGLGLTELYINSITPPPEVQDAIDDKSKLGLFDDLNGLLKMKTAMAVEKLAEQEGGAGMAAGMGMGFMMPPLFAQLYGSPEPAKTPEAKKAAHSGSHAAVSGAKCPECGTAVQGDAKFCQSCGHQLMIFRQCEECGKNLPPHARFCPRCGTKTDDGSKAPKCAKCGTENLKGAVFCNQCGEKL